MSVPTSDDEPNKPITVNAPDDTYKEKEFHSHQQVMQTWPSANTYQGSNLFQAFCWWNGTK